MNKPKISPMAILNLGLILGFIEFVGYLAVSCFLIYPLSLAVSFPPLLLASWILYLQITRLEKQPQTRIKRPISNRDEERFWFDYDTDPAYW